MSTKQSGFSGGIVLDFDDTIIATRKTRAKLFCEIALSDFGVFIPEEEINSHWGKPFNELFKNLMPRIDEKKFLSIYADQMQKHPPKILPGIQDVFYQAITNHIAVFILSSGSHKLISQDLEAAKLSKFVLKLWGYEDTIAHKPDPRVLDPLLTFSNNLGIPKNCLFYIGDSILDYHIAKSKEILFIAVLTGSTTEAEFLLTGLDREYLVENLTFIKIKRRGVFVKNKRMLSLSER